ncbi:ribosomal protein L4 [Fomitiporia mediterranea MF3/22]|uniref:ribosomal protein L4 n=1 Tax=Fomitiporia mediterranea (strain MF3/22) TaxID=694068 RepID=UPI0004407EDE|nr:ribosomal protein L4 [Fomitiporia mediterranea MF3/22]EJD04081.1 ribosomal protein L4 [Fomitiporia mediterranea MF3/22]
MLAALRRAVSQQPGIHARRNFAALESPSNSVKSLLYRDDPVCIVMSNLLESAESSEEQVAVLDPSVFAHPIRRDILYLCVNFYRDALRQGTANTKTRAEVRGSGHKIRPQKGSGRARLGDAQSPMLRGGGVAFGPKPRDFATQLPRKVRQMGLRVALSAKVQERAMAIVPTLDWQGVKTRDFAKRIDELGWTRTLFVAGGENVPAQMERVCRNVPDVDVVSASDLNVYEMLRWPKLVLDVDAVSYLERLLSKNVAEEDRIPMPSPPVLRYSRMEAGRRGKTSATIEGVDNAKPNDISESLFESS